MGANEQIRKLVAKGVSAEDAAVLVAAGLTSPRLIRAASDQRLDDAVEAKGRGTLRTLFPPVE